MKVLLHVDDSKHWHAAARIAQPLVARPGDRLVAFTTHWSRVKRHEVFEDAKRVLDVPPERVDTRARPGLAEYVIPDEVHDGDYDIVVVGRLGALDRVTNGLVAHLLARFTPTSVLLVRGRPKRVHRVLVAATGAPGTLELTRVAAFVARAHGAHLTLVHVVSQFGLTDASAAAVDHLVRDFLASGTREAEEVLAARDEAARLGVPTTVHVRGGLVVDEILDEVREHGHDLLVIGAHGMGVKKTILTEDVANHVVRSAPVSTLIVKDPGPAWSVTRA